MPSRTPDGKRLSGAAQRKRKQQLTPSQVVAAVAEMTPSADAINAALESRAEAIAVVDEAVVEAKPSPLRQLVAPPLAAGVEAVNEWLVIVLVMCGRSLQRNLEPGRASLACELARYTMGLAQRAVEAESIVTLRQLGDPYHVPAQLDTDEPPTDPVYLHLWTFRVMAQHLHATATLDQADPAVCHRAVQAAKAFGLIGKIERGEQIETERQRLKELVERRRREAKV